MSSTCVASPLVSAIKAGLALLQEGGGGRLRLVIRKGCVQGITITVEVPPPVGPVLHWLDGLAGLVARSARYGEVEVEIGDGDTIVGGTMTFSMKPNQVEALQRPGLEQLVRLVEAIR